MTNRNRILLSAICCLSFSATASAFDLDSTATTPSIGASQISIPVSCPEPREFKDMKNKCSKAGLNGANPKNVSWPMDGNTCILTCDCSWNVKQEGDKGCVGAEIPQPDKIGEALKLRDCPTTYSTEINFPVNFTNEDCAEMFPRPRNRPADNIRLQRECLRLCATATPFPPLGEQTGTCCVSPSSSRP